jgi:hypothetical protein
MMPASIIYPEQHMITETYAHRKQAGVIHVSIAATPKPRVARIHETYETRSNRNIDSWREFLPEDCVRAMIKLGWDRTT